MEKNCHVGCIAPPPKKKVQNMVSAASRIYIKKLYALSNLMDVYSSDSILILNVGL